MIAQRRSRRQSSSKAERAALYPEKSVMPNSKMRVGIIVGAADGPRGRQRFSGRWFVLEDISSSG